MRGIAIDDIKATVAAEAPKDAAAPAIEEAAKTNAREVGIEIFNEGDSVDVRGKTKGRGFAGGINQCAESFKCQLFNSYNFKQCLFCFDCHGR